MNEKRVQLIFKYLLNIDITNGFKIEKNMGGRNTVLKVTHQNVSWALRFNTKQSSQEFSSGIAWQKLLQEKGIPAVGVIAADLKGQICGIPCTVSPWIDARDIEKVLPELTIEQLKKLGKQLGSWSERMTELKSMYVGAGLVMFDNPKVSADSWLTYLRGNILWRYEQLRNNNFLGEELLFESIKDKWLSQQLVLNQAPQSLFAWDIGDRNVLVDQEGCAVALVDIDELMQGDSLISPALAYTSFAIQGLNPHYEQYVESWLKSFEKDESFSMRLWFYKTYWLFNFASKVGTIAKTGLIEVGQRDLVKVLAQNLNAECK